MIRQDPPGAGTDLLDLSPETEALLLEALERPPQERRDFLFRSTDDPAIREAVFDLLAAHASADQRLQGLGRKIGSSLDRHVAVTPSSLPTRAGPYRLERELGRGGMSVVYLGKRDDGQFEQTVAVKILPTGSVLESLTQRFESERRILARLEHPNLARLIDGGITKEGWPYFAMEYVDGIPIDEYCDLHRQDLERRLDLFGQVLDAVQYAHRNLVVHRDIKPSNILVTTEGRIKLLDFGIARVIEDAAEAGAMSDLTRLGGRPMSPAWASPEQISGQPVTTSSDVYSLAVLLYRLLTGHLPCVGKGRDFNAVRNAILERMPTRPSVKVLEPLADPETDPATLAELRGTGPRRLSRKLSGDLDNILLLALRKEPERRYATVEQFAADLERYRAGLPVRARSDTWGYRTGKLISRHAFGFATGLAILVLVGSGVLMHTERLQIERDKAEQAARDAERARHQAVIAAQNVAREAARSERVADYLVSLFHAASPGEARGRMVTAQDLVARGGEQLGRLEDDPLVRAALLTTLGEVNGALGQYGEANALFVEALELYRAEPAADPTRMADVLNHMGISQFRLGRLAEAETSYLQALELVTADTEPLLTARILSNLGVVFVVSNRFEQSAETLVGALELLERLEPGGEDHASALNILGTVRSRQERHDEAVDLLERATAMRRNLFGPDHPATTIALGNLGAVLMEAGRFAEAEPRLLEALEFDRKILGPDHPSLATLKTQLGGAQLQLEKFQSARENYRRALEIQTTRVGEDHPLTVHILANKGRVLQETGELGQAETFYRRALAVGQRVHGDSDRTMAMALHNLGTLHALRNRWHEAEEILLQALAMRLELLGEQSTHVADSHLELARAHLHTGRPETALVHGQASLEIYRLNLEPGHPRLAECEELIASISGAGL